MKLVHVLPALLCVATVVGGSVFRSQSEVASAMVRGFMSKFLPVSNVDRTSSGFGTFSGFGDSRVISTGVRDGVRVFEGTSKSKPQIAAPDMMFVLDSSGSIGSSNYTIGKKFMEFIVDFVFGQLGSSTLKPRIGVVRFSERAKTKVDFTLDAHSTADQVKQAIRAIPYDSGAYTNTAEGLKLAKAEIDRKGKPGNAKMIWVLTDGNANQGGNPATEAATIKTAGVEIYASPIGRSVNLPRIEELVSSPAMDHVYEAPTYQQARDIAQVAVTQFRQLSRGGGPFVLPGQLRAPVHPVRIPSSFFSGLRNMNIRRGPAFSRK